VERYDKAGQVTDKSIIRRMRIACWISKATYIHSQYVILIAFPLRHYLRERDATLRYRYIASPVKDLFRSQNETF
jgi:hypothetical protein